MRLLEATVDRYGRLAGWSPELSENLTVLSGPNEAGKTLYLEAMLQLMEPAVVEVLEPPRRFDDEPVGRVSVEYEGEHYDLGERQPLSAISPIHPTDLQTIFVVRDNDLSMPTGPGYYTDLIEHLGEIHTSAIEAITDELKRVGRLTDTRLDISNQYDDAAVTHERAETLVREIDELITKIEAEDWDQLQAERLSLEGQLQEVRDQLQRQEAAQRAHEYERLSEHLSTYRCVGAELAELEGVDRERYQELRELASDIDHADRELTQLENQQEQYRSKYEQTTDNLEEAKKRQTRLTRREGAVDTVRKRLEAYREQSIEETAAKQQAALGKWVAAGGALGAGLAGAAGASTGAFLAWLVAGVLLLVTFGGAVMAYRRSQSLATAEAAAEAALAAARDAGFEVTAVTDIAGTIEAFEEDLALAKEAVIRLETEVENLEDDLDRMQTEYENTQKRVEELRSELDQALADAGVDSLDELQQIIERREELQTQQKTAGQSLKDALGEPEATDWEAKAASWESALADIAADIDDPPTLAEAYDEHQLQSLREQHESLKEQRAALTEALERYDSRIEAIDEQARSISAQPFIDSSLRLEGKTPTALRTLQADATALVEAIERDADLSRKAIQLFESIADEEEQKISELFTPDGTAAEAFAHITDGRYTHLDYDTETAQLVVERDTGEELGPAELSEGTRDQLYLASRLSLAERLLDGQPGFLLLDDPLVGADPDRLARGFETLGELAVSGWQVLYFTAKEEVYVDMVERFDLAHERVDPIA